MLQQMHHLFWKKLVQRQVAATAIDCLDAYNAHEDSRYHGTSIAVPATTNTIILQTKRQLETSWLTFDHIAATEMYQAYVLGVASTQSFLTTSILMPNAQTMRSGLKRFQLTRHIPVQCRETRRGCRLASQSGSGMLILITCSGVASLLMLGAAVLIHQECSPSRCVLDSISNSISNVSRTVCLISKIILSVSILVGRCSFTLAVSGCLIGLQLHVAAECLTSLRLQGNYHTSAVLLLAYIFGVTIFAEIEGMLSDIARHMQSSIKSMHTTQQTKHKPFAHRKHANSKYWCRMRHRSKTANKGCVYMYCTLLNKLTCCILHILAVQHEMHAKMTKLARQVMSYIRMTSEAKAATEEAADNGLKKQKKKTAPQREGMRTEDKPKGGRSRWKQKHEDTNNLQCQPIHTPTGMYMEQQFRKFCQLHALNAFFGKNIVQPMTMLLFCKAEIDRLLAEPLKTKPIALLMGISQTWQLMLGYTTTVNQHQE